MTPFSALLAGLRADGDTYHAFIPEDWQQGRTTFGGLTAALCVAAAQRAVPDLPTLRSAQLTFVGPAGGTVEMTPRLLRRGKSSVFVSAELKAEGTLAALAAFSFGMARESRCNYRSHPIPSVLPVGATSPFFRSGKPKFTQHFEGFAAGGPKLLSGAATPELLLWLRHRDPEAMRGLPGIIALADTAPAAAFTMLSAPVPVSSVTWSIEMVDAAAALHAPADGWYLLRTAGDDVREGYSVQDMALWSQDGTLILLARQTVAIFG